MSTPITLDDLSPEEAERFVDLLEEFFPELKTADAFEGSEVIEKLIELYQELHDKEAE